MSTTTEGLWPLTAAEQQLVLEHLPLVRRVARHYDQNPQYDDLAAHLAFQLCRIVRRYQQGSPAKLATFITESLAGEVKKFFRDYTWMVKPPREVREARRIPEDVQSARSPLSLHETVPGASEVPDQRGELIADEYDLEADVVRRISAHQRTTALFQALASEDRLILALKMKRTDKEVEEELHCRFKIPLRLASAALEELKTKAQELYWLQENDQPLPPPTAGNRVIREALWNHFQPSFVAARSSQ